jgi:hypothetical protein
VTSFQPRGPRSGAGGTRTAAQLSKLKVGDLVTSVYCVGTRQGGGMGGGKYVSLDGAGWSLAFALPVVLECVQYE